MSNDYVLESLAPNIMVADVNKSIDFYQQQLGFQTIMTVPPSGKFEWAMMMKDNVTIMLHLKNSMQTEYPQFQNKPIGGTVISYITIKNIDALYQEFKGKETMIKDLHKTFYGMKEFSICDLDGYVLTFSERAS